MKQEPKYRFQNGNVISRSSGKAIPPDEPVMVFRAQDCHAVQLISLYADLVQDSHHRKVVLTRQREFEEFAINNPHRMKEPDSGTAGG